MSNNGAAKPRTDLVDDDATVDEQAAIDNDEDPATDFTVEVSPRQLAGGFAIIAAILVLLVRHRRRRRAAANKD